MIAGPREGRFVLCLLAGGRSGRFGSSKLRVTLDDEPIVSWQMRRLLDAGDAWAARECWISLAPGADLPPGGEACSRRVDDAVAFDGPLSGMVEVLKKAGAKDVVAFVPADMPAMTSRHVGRLIASMDETHGTVGVMARWADGTHQGVVEPLPSVWRAGAAAALIEEAMREGVRGPSKLAGRKGVACIPLTQATDEQAWRSVNTREDLAAIAHGLGVMAGAG